MTETAAVITNQQSHQRTPQKSKNTPSLSSLEDFQRITSLMKRKQGDFPGGPVVESPPCNAGDTGSIPGWGTKIIHAHGQIGGGKEEELLA